MAEKLFYETKRLVLQPPTLEDAPFFIELFNSPKWLKFIGDRNVHSISDAENYITTKMLPQQEKLGFGIYVLIEKTMQEKVGTCGLYDRPGLEGVDLGYALLPQFEGNGYINEAAEKLLELAKNEFNLTQVKAITTLNHIASHNVLLKLGFKIEKQFFMEGDSEELYLFSKSLS